MSQNVQVALYNPNVQEKTDVINPVLKIESRQGTTLIRRNFIKLSEPNSNVIRALFKHNYHNIKPCLLLKFFNKWRYENIHIRFRNNETGEIFTTPVTRRGNKRFYKRTNGRLWRILNEYKSFKAIHNKQKEKEFIKGKNRTIFNSNQLFITLTYRTQLRGISENWSECGHDFDRYFRNLKKRLLTRGNKILYYIRAWENQRDGIPHIHILVKLKKAIKYYRQYNPSKRKIENILINREFYNWKYGITSTFAIHEIKEGSNKAFGYISKYITKVANPKNKKASINLALQWIFRKKSFSNTRLKRSKAIKIDDVYSHKSEKRGKLYQVIGFTKVIKSSITEEQYPEITEFTRTSIKTFKKWKKRSREIEKVVKILEPYNVGLGYPIRTRLDNSILLSDLIERKKKLEEDLEEEPRKRRMSSR